MSKIILDCDLMRHPNSGLYHYCLNLGNHVTQILKDRQSDQQLYYYVPRGEENAFNDKTKCIREKRKWHKLYKPFMHDCSIWHAPFQSGRMLPGKNSKVRVLLTIHDLNCLHEGKPHEEVERSIDHTQHLIDRSDAIVCISEFCKQDVLRNCNIAHKPVYVIHNGTHQLAEPRLGQHSYKPVRPFLFAMGYVNRKKNFHVLLSLLKGNAFELLIAGRLDEPDYVQYILSQAEAMNVSDRIRILGPVSEEDKAWYMAHCEAYVHPSLAEGFGAPVVEAMAFGKPLFLSRLTSLPEIGSDVAFYFDHFSEDHMNQVLKEGMQAYRRNGLADEIRRRGREFDWKHKAAEYIRVYESLL